MSEEDEQPFGSEGVLRVEEDSPPFVFERALVNITAGPGGEDSFQELSFVVSNDNPSLFSEQPALTSDGTLTFELAPDMNGRSEITLFLQDTGGFPSGVSCDRSFDRFFSVETIPWNDPPSWDGGYPLAFNLNLGPISLPLWAVNMSAGPPDEANQTLSFVVSTENPGLFTTPPTVLPNGTLQFESALDTYGYTTFNITLEDDGGPYQSPPEQLWFDITIWGPPTITSVSPVIGPTMGFRLTVTGSLFRPPELEYGMSVSVAGLPCVGLEYTVEGELTCWVQPGVGTHKLVDMTVDTLPNTDLSFYISYRPPTVLRVDPPVGPNDGGVVRTLVGLDFGVDNSYLNSTALYWNQEQLTILNTNATHLDFYLPPGLPAQTDSLVVVVDGQEGTADVSFEHYIVPPRWTSDFVPLVANVSFQTMDIYWEAAEGSYLSPVDHYEIDMVSLVLNQTTVRIVLGNVLQYEARNLTTGELYAFIIYAVNDGGPGPGRSTPDTVAAGALDPPSMPALTNATKGTIQLSWSDPNPPESAVIKHRVQQRLVAIPVDASESACNCSVHEDWRDSYPQPPGKVQLWRVERLVPGATYEFRAAAMNVQNDVDWSEASEPMLAADRPGPVQAPITSQPATTCGTTVVELVHPVDGGSPLTLLSVQTRLGGGAWSPAAPPSVSPAAAASTIYSITGLVPGGLYTFRAMASNIVGDGAFGNATAPFRVSDPPVPVSPEAIQVVATARTANVSFPSPDKGCIEIESYLSSYAEKTILSTRPLPLNTTFLATGPAQLSFLPGPGYAGHASALVRLYNLQPYTTYDFSVLSVNEVGQSLSSAHITFRTLPDVPVVPDQPETRAATPGSIMVEWIAPYDNGAPITGYVVQAACYDCFYLNTWYDTTEQPVGAQVFVEVSGWDGFVFESGVLYKFRVRAVNSVGRSGFSVASERAAAALPPDPPSQFSIAPVSSSERLDISWNEPTRVLSDGSTARADGGNIITHYLVQISLLVNLNDPTIPGNPAFPETTQWTNWTLLAQVPSPPLHPIGGALSTAAVNLGPSSTYRLRARTHNDAGFSAWSPTVQATTQAGKPNAAAAPIAGNGTKSSVFVRWTAPYGGGSPITGYALEYQDVGATDWTFFPFPLGYDPTLTHINVTDLASGFRFVFRVIAYSFRGAAAPSPPSNPVFTAVVPSAPNAPKLSNVTINSVKLTWNTPDNGGIPIQTYRVQQSQVVNGTLTGWQSIVPLDTAATGAPPATTAVATQLITGATYRFRVSASNQVDFGPYSDVSADAFVAVVPDPPTHTRVENASAVRMEAVFDAPVRFVGADILRFEVQSVYRNGSDPLSPLDSFYTQRWQLVGSLSVPAAMPPKLFVSASGLLPGNFYAFRVRACNVLGCGPVGTPSNFTLAAEKPPPPARVRVSLPTQSTLFVAWTALTVDTGAAPIQWQLQLAEYNVTTGVTGSWLLPNPDLFGYSTLSTTVGSLMLGFTYVFRIRVRNIVGWSDYSTSSVPQLVAIPPPSPATPILEPVYSVGAFLHASLSFTLRGVGGAKITSVVMQQSFADYGIWSTVPLSVTPLTDPTIDFAFFKESARGQITCCLNTTDDYTVMRVALRDLVPGAYYKFRVAAGNVMGVGAYSGASNVLFSGFVGLWVEHAPTAPKTTPPASSLYPKGFPFNTFYHDTKFQSLFYEGEIALGKIFISGVAIRVLEQPARDLENVRIGLKRVDAYSLTTFQENVDVRFHSAFISRTELIPGNWFLFKFRDSFEKPDDATTNFVVEFSMDGRFWSKGGAPYMRAVQTLGGPRSVIGTSDSLAGSYPFPGRRVDPNLRGNLEVHFADAVAAVVLTYDTTKVGCDGVDRGDGTYAKYDRCLVCEGTDECVGCDDVPFSGLTLDACGVCNGGNVSCTGCDGVLFSGATYDLCYVCNGNNECVGNVSTVVGTTLLPEPLPFLQPSDIIIDTLGTTYVVDTQRSRVVLWDFLRADLAQTFVGGNSATPSANAGYVDSIGTSARFRYPEGVTADNFNNLVVADTGNHRLRLVSPRGDVTSMAGNEAGYLDESGTNARFSSPCCVAFDASGSVWVADSGNFRVRKVTPTGEVSTVAGSDKQGWVDGAGGSAMFHTLRGIAVDAAGRVYVSDQNRIRVISPAGVVSTLAGGAAAGWQNGLGTAALFSAPQKLAVDQDGNLLVADSGNHVIRRVLLDDQNRVQTLAGNLTAGYLDSPDGANPSMLSAPVAVTVDRDFNITVADSGNNVVRSVQLFPPRFTVPANWTAAGCSAWNYANDDGCDCNCDVWDPDCDFAAPPGGACAAGHVFGNDAGACMMCPVPGALPQRPRPVSTWTAVPLTSANVLEFGVGMQAVGTALFLFGGRDSEKSTEVCDLSFNAGLATPSASAATTGSALLAVGTTTCSQLAKMPVETEQHVFAANSNGTAIFVFGGLRKGTPVHLCLRYTIASNTWAALGNVPAALQPFSVNRGQVVAVGDAFLVFEYFDHSAAGQVYRFDPEAVQWTLLATLPHARADFGLVAVGALVHLVGGVRVHKFADAANALLAVTTPATDVLTFDTQATADGKQWLTGVMAAPLTSLTRPNLAWVGEDSVYAVNPATSTLQQYSIQRDAWYPLTVIPRALVWPGLAEVAGQLYVYDRSPADNSLAAYAMDMDLEGRTEMLVNPGCEVLGGWSPTNLVDTSQCYASSAAAGVPSAVEGSRVFVLETTDAQGSLSQELDVSRASLWFARHQMFAFDSWLRSGGNDTGAAVPLQSAVVEVRFQGLNREVLDAVRSPPVTSSSAWTRFRFRRRAPVDTEFITVVLLTRNTPAVTTNSSLPPPPAPAVATSYFDGISLVLEKAHHTFVAHRDMNPGLVPDGTAQRPYYSLRDAVDAVADGDIIFLLPGRYAGDANVGLGVTVNSYSLVAMSGVHYTRVDALFRGTPFVWQDFNGAYTVVEGVTVTRGSGREGGGVYVKNAQPYLVQVDFFDNYATYGGALYADELSSPHISQSRFFGNLATRHGGAAYLHDSSALLSQCSVNENRASFGSGLYVKDSAGRLDTLAGTGAFGLADGQGTFSQFQVPRRVAYDMLGNAIVSDNLVLRIISPDGTTRRLAGSGVKGHLDGPAGQARFGYPRGLTVDADNYVFVADTENSCIRLVSPNGVVSTLAGSRVQQAGWRDDPSGANGNALFDYPNDLALAPGGKIYVADTNNHRVRVLTPVVGRYRYGVSTLAGSGARGLVNSALLTSRFAAPNAILYRDSVLYVCDSGNHAFRTVRTDGGGSSSEPVRTLAGSAAGYADAKGSSALFNSPSAIAWDVDFNIVVADTGNHRLRRLTVGGDSSTVAGGESPGYSDGNVIRKDVLLSSPTGVACAADGSVLVVDSGNVRVRRFVPPARVTSLELKRNSVLSSGGVYIDSSASVFSGVVAEANSGPVGSVLAVQAGDATSIASSVFINCVFRRNVASQTGTSWFGLGAKVQLVGVVFDGNQAWDGSCVYMSAFSAVHLTRCRFLSNRVFNQFGGTSFHGADSRATYTDCLFNDSLADQGGALYHDSGSETLLKDCVFTLNNANVHGGAQFAAVDAVVHVAGCTYSANTAAGSGGAVYAEGSTLTVDATLFEHNGASSLGGAVFYNALDQAQHGLYCTDVRFEHNQVEFGDGGALSASSLTFASRQLLTRCAFSRNSAPLSKGGGLSLRDRANLEMVACTAEHNFGLEGGFGVLVGRANLTAVDCAFDQNQATTFGGALSVATKASCYSRANVYTDNLAEKGSGGAVAVSAQAYFSSSDDDFVSNSAPVSGGAIYANSDTSTVVTGAFFLDNTAALGAAAEFEAAAAGAFSASNFTSNDAGNSGGALYLRDAASVSVAGSSFDSNSAALDGGAVCFAGGAFSCAGSLFARNAANKGGAVMSFVDTYAFWDSEFAENSAAEDGGSLFLQRFTGAASTLARLDFAFNTAGNAGGAWFWLQHGSAPLCANCTADGNAAQYGADFASGSARLAVLAAPRTPSTSDEFVTPALQVEVLDHYGQRVVTDDDTSIEVGSNSSDLVVAGNRQSQSYSGVAIFPEVDVEATPGSYTMRFFARVSTPANAMAPVDGEVVTAATYFPFDVRVCRPGELQVYAPVPRCELCPQGTYNALSDQTACLPCAAGTFAGHRGQSVCTACNAGYFCPGGEPDETECPRGTYSSEQGAHECRVCPKATYATSTASSACLTCAASFFYNKVVTDIYSGVKAPCTVRPVLSQLYPPAGKIGGGTTVVVVAVEPSASQPTTFQDYGAVRCRFSRVSDGIFRESTGSVILVHGVAALQCNSPDLPPPPGQEDTSSFLSFVEITENGVEYTSTGPPVILFTFFREPVVTSVSPKGGPTTVVSTVRVSGRGFPDSVSTFGDVQCRFGNEPALSALSVTATQVVCPAHDGVADVAWASVTIALNGPASEDAAHINADADFTQPNGVQYRYYLPPVVRSFVPLGCPFLSRTTITLFGANFISGIGDPGLPKCRFIGMREGDVETTATIVNDTIATCRAPRFVVDPDPEATKITSSDHVLALTLNNQDYLPTSTFRFYKPPTLDNVVPPGGPRDSAAVLLTIYGLDFEKQGLYNETVFDDGSRDDNTGYLCRFSTSAAPQLPFPGYLPGSKLFTTVPEITVAKFDLELAVLNCRPPRVSTLGFLFVEVSFNGIDYTQSPSPLRYYVYNPPVLRSVVPAGGPETGDFRITIKGTNFAPTAYVNEFVGLYRCGFGVGGSVSYQPASFLSGTNDTLVCTAPQSTSGTYLLDVQLNGYRLKEPAASNLTFVYYKQISVGDNSPRGGPLQGNTLLAVSVTVYEPRLPLGVIYCQLHVPNTASFLGLFDAKTLPPATPGVAYSAELIVTCPTPPVVSDRVVTVELSLNNASFVDGSEFTYYTSPVANLLTLSPPGGPVEGDTTVQVLGNNFLDNMGTATRDNPNDGLYCRFGYHQDTPTKYFAQVPGELVFALGLPAGLRCQSPAVTGHQRIYIEVSLNGLDFTFSNKSLPLGNRYDYYEAPSFTGISPVGAGRSSQSPVNVQGAGFLDDSPALSQFYSCRFTYTAADGSQVAAFSRSAVLSPTLMQCLQTPLIPSAVLSFLTITFNGLDYTEPDTPGVNRFYFYEDLDLEGVLPRGGPVAGATVIRVSNRGTIGDFTPLLWDRDAKCRFVHRSSGQAVTIGLHEDPRGTTALTCKVPPLTAFNVSGVADASTVPMDLTVTLNNRAYSPNAAAGKPPFTYTYYKTTIFSEMRPAGGPATGGTKITILGENFLSGMGGIRCKFHATYADPDIIHVNRSSGFVTVERAEPIYVVVPGVLDKGNNIVCYAPAMERNGTLYEGTSSMEVTLNGFDYTVTANVNEFVYYKPPLITSLSRWGGVSVGGDTTCKGCPITVTGTGFFDSALLSPFFRCRYRYVELQNGELLELFAPAQYVSDTVMHCALPVAASPGVTKLLISMNNQDYTGEGEPYVFYQQVKYALTNALIPIGGPTKGVEGLPRSKVSVSLDLVPRTRELLANYSSTLKCRFGDEVVAGGNIPIEGVDNRGVVSCRTPDGSKGQVVLKVALNGVDFTGPNSFTYYDPVKILQVVPSGGPVEGGTLIDVQCSGLSGLDNLHQCRLTNRATGVYTTLPGTLDETGLVLSCKTPAGLSAGPYALRVSLNQQDWSAEREGFSFVLYGDPVVHSFSPQAGPVTGGTRVTLVGHGFHRSGGDLMCKFATTQAVDAATGKPPRACPAGPLPTPADVCEVGAAAYESANAVVCLMPPLNSNQARAGVKLYVSLNTGRDWVAVLPSSSAPAVGPRRLVQATAAAAASVFQVYPNVDVFAVLPIAGPHTGNSVVNVTGQNFQDFPKLACNFAKDGVVPTACANCSATFVSADTVLCKAPPQPASGRSTAIIYVSLNGQWGPEDLKHSTVEYLWFRPPEPGWVVHPVSGKLHGGTVVTFTGSGFNNRVGQRKCRFGAAVVIANELDPRLDPTQVFNCNVPPATPGDVRLDISLNGVDWIPTPQKTFTYYGEDVFITLSVRANASMSDADVKASVAAHLVANSGVPRSRLLLALKFIPDPPSAAAAAAAAGRRHLLQANNSTATSGGGNATAATATTNNATASSTNATNATSGSGGGGGGGAPRGPGSYEVRVTILDSPDRNQSALSVSAAVADAAAVPMAGMTVSPPKLSPETGTVTRVYPLSGPNAGSPAVTVFGSAFRRDLGSVMCRFTEAQPKVAGAEPVVVTALADPGSEESYIVCPAPRCSKCTRSFTVEVSLNGADFSVSKPPVGYFYYEQFEVRTMVPQLSTVLGNRDISMAGLFFSSAQDVPSLELKCRFTLEFSKTVVRTNGTINNFETATCKTPVYHQPELFYFAIGINDVDEDYYGVPFMYEAYLEPTMNANRPDVQQPNPKPLRGSDAGGTVTITGADFRPDLKSFCQFQTSDGALLPIVNATSSKLGNELTCPAPRSQIRGPGFVRISLNGVHFTTKALTYDYECGEGKFLTDALKFNVEDACEKCAPGTYNSAVGASACMPCPIGTYRTQDGGESLRACLPCEDGEFTPFNGSHVCYACQERHPAALPTGDRSDCFCPIGYFGKTKAMNWGSLEFSFPADSEKATRTKTFLDTCKLCDNKTEVVGAKGAVCDKATLLLPQLNIDPGYWRYHPLSENFYPCPEPKACLGSNNSGTGQVLCAPEYQGNLCSDCIDGYGATGFSCSDCAASAALNTILLIVVPLATIGVVAFMVRGNLSSGLENKGTSVVIKILLNYWQFTALAIDFPIVWQGAMGDFLDTSEKSSSGGAAFQIPAVDCMVTRDYYAMLLFYVSLPVVCVLLPLIGFSVAAWVMTWKRTTPLTAETKKWLSDAGTISVLVAMFLIYPSVTKELLQVFQCVDVDLNRPEGLTPLLIQDPTVECSTQKHQDYQLMAVFMVLAYGIGIPLSGTALLFKKRNHLFEEATQISYGFLYVGYDMHTYWWEVVLQIRKFIVALLIVFVQSDFESVFFTLAIVEISLVLTMIFRPFLSELWNNLETLSLFTSSLTMHVALFSFKFIVEPNDDEGLQADGLMYTTLSNVMVGINATTAVVIVCSLVVEAKHKVFEKVGVDEREGWGALIHGVKQMVGGGTKEDRKPRGKGGRDSQMVLHPDLIAQEDDESEGEETDDDDLNEMVDSVGSDDDEPVAFDQFGTSAQGGVAASGRGREALGPFDDAEGRIAQV